MLRVLKNVGLVLLVLAGFACILMLFCGGKKAIERLFHPVDCSCCSPKS